jgi:polyvinyl alcohol dehydrogenase (cytochrome)
MNTRMRKARRHTLRRVSLLPALLAATLVGLLAGSLAINAYAEPAWTTYHRDAARSGDDPEATNPITPTLAWQTHDLGAPIWGQPLILGSRVYVATVGDEIYALDAATGEVIWEKSAGTPVPAEDVLCGDIEPTVGIVGTPVIDVATNAIYAVADVWNETTKEAHHELEGFNLNNGEQVLSTAVDPPGANPKTLLERPALDLDEGKVVFGFGGNAGDCGEYDGAVVAAPVTGGPPSIWQYTPAPPAYGGAAVWGPSGPAVDSEGHVYVSTGNPDFPEHTEVKTYDDSDSVIELNSAMELIGNFEPESWLSDSNHDRDLSSSGPELLPGGLMFQAGKNEMGYLIDEATMSSGAAAVYHHKVCKAPKKEGDGEGSFGGDAYANGTIYVPCEDGVRALAYNQAARTFTELWHGPADATGPPIVSGGLVWVVSGEFLKGGGTKLYGLDPATGTPRYTETLPSPVVDHFASPSAAGGRVFVATGSSVTAYQIAQISSPPNPPTVVTEPAASVTQATATLNASVNPNGAGVTECSFEYGPTTSYGSSVPCSSLPGSGETPVSVSASLSSLSADTTYHYRIVATNPGGTHHGGDETFKTLPNPPTVASEPATTVTQTTATLNASVNPNGANVSECNFEYGPTTTYGSSIPCSSLPGSGETAIAVSATLSSLGASTSYHYRLVATNPGGTHYGSDETFTTLPNPSQAPGGQAAPGELTTTPTPLTQQNPGKTGLLSFEEHKSPSASAVLLTSSLTASHSGTIAVKLSCPATVGSCAGTVTLRTVTSGHRSRKPAPSLRLAAGSFNILGGHKATIKLHLLTAKISKLVEHGRRQRVRVALVTHNPGGVTATSNLIATLR